MALKGKDYVRITIGIAAIIFGVWKLICIYKADKAKENNTVTDDKMESQADSTFQE